MMNFKLFLAIAVATIFSATDAFPNWGRSRPSSHSSNQNSYSDRENVCIKGRCVRSTDCPEDCVVLKHAEPCHYSIDDTWVCCTNPYENYLKNSHVDLRLATQEPQRVPHSAEVPSDAWREYDFDSKQYNDDLDYTDYESRVRDAEGYYPHSWRKSSTRKPVTQDLWSQENAAQNWRKTTERAWNKRSTLHSFNKHTSSTENKLTTVKGWNNVWHQASTVSYQKKTADPFGMHTTASPLNKKTTKVWNNPPTKSTTLSTWRKPTESWNKSSTKNYSFHKKTTEIPGRHSTRKHPSTQPNKPFTSSTPMKTTKNVWNKHTTSIPFNKKTTVSLPRFSPTKNWINEHKLSTRNSWIKPTKNDWEENYFPHSSSGKTSVYFEQRATPSYGKSTSLAPKPTSSTKASRRSTSSGKDILKTNLAAATIWPISATQAWSWPESEEMNAFDWESTINRKSSTRPSSIRTTPSVRNIVNSSKRSSTKRNRITTPMPNVNTHACGIRDMNIGSNRDGRNRNDRNSNTESRHSRKPFARIVGGEEVEPFSWPWVAALHRVTYPGGGKRFLCAGSLINAYYVLTAAHVFTPDDMRSSSYVVMLGIHNVSDAFSEYMVSSVLQHPQYQQRYYYNDIALLRLGQPVIFNDYIMPVCLPSPQAPLLRDSNLEGKRVTVMGWGDDSFGGRSSIVLQKTTFPIVSRQSCNASYFRVALNQFPRGITEDMLCAGSPRGGKDACQGDSGGPLTSIENGRYTQVGIVSFGYKCGDREFPGVYTKVAHYLGWIAENTRDRNPYF